MNAVNKLKQLENNKIYNLLKSTGNEIYLVGGIVRDILSERLNISDIHDFDIIVNDMPAHDFAYRFKGCDNVETVITLDDINNIYRIIMKDKINYIDVTNPINGDLSEDIKRRDLTINSIVYDIKNDELIDLTGGLSDIKTKKLKAISEQNFTDDPLRILRTFRFASVLGYEIDKSTVDITKRHRDLILTPSIERINVEILKLFGGRYTDIILKQMDRMGIIDILFPIMLDVKKVPPNTHHHLDLFNHSISTVKYIQEIYETSGIEVRSHLDKIDFGGESRLAHLKFAGFLHDIGKFSTWTIEDNGRHRFIRHDEIGAELAKGILKEQKFSKKQIDYISFVIRNHIYPSSVISSPEINDKIYMRYIRKAGDNSIDLITIAKADRLSARGEAITEKMVQDNIDGLNRLQDFYIEVKPTLKPLPKLLNGHEIMEILNIPQSNTLGKIIQSLHEAQLNQTVSNKEEAINFIKNIQLENN